MQQLTREGHFFGPSKICEKNISPRYLRGLSADPRTTKGLLRVTAETKMQFVFQRYLYVFSLDVSPSMSVVDTSYKGFSTGCYLLNCLLPSLHDALLALLQNPMKFGDADFEPEVYVTVIAQGCPAFQVRVLVQGCQVTLEGIPEFMERVTEAYKKVIDELCTYHQEMKEVILGHECSRYRFFVSHVSQERISARIVSRTVPGVTIVALRGLCPIGSSFLL